MARQRTEKLPFALRTGPTWEPWQAACLERLAPLAEPVLLLGRPPSAPLADLPVVAIDAPDLAERLQPLAFVLDLGDEPPLPQLASAIQAGWWYFRDGHGHAPGRMGRGAVLAGERFVVVRLLRPSADGSAEQLEEGCLRTVTVSPAKTRARVLAGIADWPAHQAHRLAAGLPLDPRPVPVTAAPEPVADWRLRLARGRNFLRRVAEQSQDDAWCVGVIEAPAASLLDGFDPRRIRWLPQLPGGFIADPMALAEPDGAAPAFLFAEGFRFGEDKGFIVRAPLTEGGRAATPVLVEDVHLSYPYLIRHRGMIYCLPEMSAARRVQLYRADPWPERWAPDRVLLDGFAGADATVIEQDGRFWMFVADAEDELGAKLFLFHAPDLLGPWTPHPMNPVKADLRGSRPAGPLFRAQGALIRPAQDCTTTYGAAITLQRITRLTPDDFAEEAVGRLAPDPDGPWPDGLHTLTPAGPITLVDGKRLFWRPRRLLDSVRALRG